MSSRIYLALSAFRPSSCSSKPTDPSRQKSEMKQKDKNNHTNQRCGGSTLSESAPPVIKVCVVTITRVDLKDVFDKFYSTITELQDTQSSPADQTTRTSHTDRASIYA